MPDEDCIFCGIVAGDIPSRDVYETEEVLAFLDANPLAAGHTLVVPKTHCGRLGELSAATAADMGRALTVVPEAAEAAVDADATTVAVNDGEAAGQEIPHVHAHIVPRTAEDSAGPIHALFTARPSLSDGELDDIASSISDRC